MEIYKPLLIEDYKAELHDAPHLLLDVRTVEEYTDYRIPGAVNMPLPELESRMDEVQQLAGDKPIVMVCKSGVRSIMAAQIARYHGLLEIDIYNLEEGTQGWGKRGFPLNSG
jgi:sulfur-carrier protein adenylyltransferase/sulfurtransferase